MMDVQKSYMASQCGPRIAEAIETQDFSKLDELREMTDQKAWWGGMVVRAFRNGFIRKGDIGVLLVIAAGLFVHWAFFLVAIGLLWISMAISRGLHFEYGYMLEFNNQVNNLTKSMLGAYQQIVNQREGDEVSDAMRKMFDPSKAN